MFVEEASESNSMHGLGLSAFLPGGYTQWRDIEIPVSTAVGSIQVEAIVANVGDGSVDSRVFVDFVQEEIGNSDGSVQPTITWDENNGGISLRHEILTLSSLDRKISLYWAKGNDVMGDAFFNLAIPAGKAPGVYGPTNVPLKTLGPEGVTGILAVAGTRKQMLPDVEILKGSNADFSTVIPLMFRIIKAGLRAAGQPKAYISSTARSAADQARAMFDNLVKEGKTVAQNIQDQLALYAAAGDSIVRVFETECCRDDARANHGLKVKHSNCNDK